MGLLRLKVNGEYVTVAQGPAGPIGPQGPAGPEIAVLTTAERDALIAPDLFEGKVIYNTDLDVYQGYVGGSWGDIITSTGGTMTGRLNLKSFRETIQNFGAVSGTITLDPSISTIKTIDPNGAVTFQFANFGAGDTLYLRINGWQAGFGSITWPAGLYWNGGPPTLLANKHHVITFISEAGAYWASYAGAYVQ